MKIITAIEAVKLLQTKWGITGDFSSPKAFCDAVCTDDKRAAGRYFPQMGCYANAWDAWEPANPLQPTVSFDRKALPEIKALFEGCEIWGVENPREFPNLDDLAAKTNGEVLRFWTNLPEGEMDLYIFAKRLIDVAKTTETEISFFVDNLKGGAYSVRIAKDGTFTCTGAQILSSSDQGDFVFQLAYSMEKFALSSYEQMEEIGFRFAVEE